MAFIGSDPDWEVDGGDLKGPPDLCRCSQPKEIVVGMTLYGWCSLTTQPGHYVAVGKDGGASLSILVKGIPWFP